MNTLDLFAARDLDAALELSRLILSCPRDPIFYLLPLENSRFPRNIDIPRNIRAKLGGSPEYWGESRNIGGISEEVGCLKIHK